jgi:hypothetical protein
MFVWLFESSHAEQWSCYLICSNSQHLALVSDILCRCDLRAHNASVLTIEDLATMNGTVTFPRPTVIDRDIDPGFTTAVENSHVLGL